MPTAPAEWVPVEVDLDRPNAARVYDYLLGGAHNFGPDRKFADKLLEHAPAREFARANRAFLGRVVRYLVLEASVRQFLDLGSGIPTVGNVHEIAQRAAPDTRVVYVDVEPVAVAHAKLLLADNPLACAIGGDLRHPQQIFDHPDTRQLIDFTRPVAVLMCAVLHFIPDVDDPFNLVAQYRDALCPGSYLTISHATADDYPDDLGKAVEMYNDTSTPGTLRTHSQITELFGGLLLLPPGLVFTPQWRSEQLVDGDPRRSLSYGGVAVL